MPCPEDHRLGGVCYDWRMLSDGRHLRCVISWSNVFAHALNVVRVMFEAKVIIALVRVMFMIWTAKERPRGAILLHQIMMINSSDPRHQSVQCRGLQLNQCFLQCAPSSKFHLPFC